MKHWLEKYFGFTDREIRGLFVFFLIIGIIFAIPSLGSRVKISEKGAINRETEREIYDFLNSLTPSDESENGLASSGAEQDIEYFNFDPNHLSFQDGKRLGLNERQIRMIQNYVSSGGTFYKAEDFKKIYAISQADYVRLAPFISISEVYSNTMLEKENNFSSNSHKGDKPIVIELNSTDSIELQSLRGIGPVFASRIVRFRDNLGGFHSVLQLLDVYGMDQDRFDGIKEQVVVDTSLLKKIRINVADFEALRRHSYISSKQANAIVHYRKQHGDFKSLEDLLEIHLIDEEILRKIAPYLKFTDD